MNPNMVSHSHPPPADPDLIIRRDENTRRNIGHLLNNDESGSDLVLIVGETHFNVHRNIMAVESDYFRCLLNNGMCETSKDKIPIDDESNVYLFEKLLQYVYSGEMKFEETNEMIEMLLMANKYLMDELQKSIETLLGAIVSPRTFCSIYSAALVSSASDLRAACFKVADEDPEKILKADGLSNMDVHALNDIIGRESFKPDQSKLFDAIEKWIAMNPYKDAELLLSNIRLDLIPIPFLLEKVRPSKLFDDNRIVLAVTAFIPIEMANSIPMTIKVTVDFRRRSGTTNLHTIYLVDQYPFDTIARVKEQIRLQYNDMSLHAQAFPDYSISLYFQSTRLQDDRTLESYDIGGGAQLVARCSNDYTATAAIE